MTEEIFKNDPHYFSTISYDIPLPGNSGKYYLYVLAKDNAGNTAMAESKLYTIDRVKPSIEFITKSNSEYSNNIDIKVKITDDTNGSGLKDGSLKYLWKTESKQPIKDDFKKTINIDSSFETTIPLEENMGGTYYLYIYAEDNAGNNIIKGSGAYKIDNVKPTIKLSKDQEENYKSSHTVTITATDNIEINSDSTSLKYFWSMDNHDEINENLFTNAKSYTSYYPISTYGLKEDGEYYLYVQAIDKAGNKAFHKSSGVFKLDVTAPKITINPETNKDKLTNKDLKVNIKIEDVSQISLKQYIWQNNDTTPTNKSNMIDLNNTTEYINLPSADGEYYLWVYAIDLLGNVNWIKSNDKFIVDNTAPSAPQIIAKQVGSDAEISNDSAIGPDVELTIIPGIDTRYDAKVTLNFHIEKDGQLIEEENLNQLKSGDVYKDILKENGVYTITASCTDDAGNTSSPETKLTFKIDSTVPRMPTIHLKEAGTDNIIPNYSEVNKKVKVEVKDQKNETTDITISKDGILDPEIKDENSEIILKESGSYIIHFETYTSGDTAKAKSIKTEMHIVIDKDPPTAYDTAAHTVEQNESHSDSLDATDNYTIVKYIITKNPELGKLSAFNEENGTFTYTPNDGAYGTDTFKFKVKDKAGNESNEATITIKIRKNLVASDIVTNTTININENETYTSNSFISKDLNGLDLTYRVYQNAVDGNVEFNDEAKKFVYTPKQDFYGTDRFTIRVTNGFNVIDILFTIQVKQISSGHSGSGGGGRRWWRWKHHN